MTSRSSAFGGGSSRSSRLGRISRQRFSGLDQTAMREWSCGVRFARARLHVRKLTTDNRERQKVGCLWWCVRALDPRHAWLIGGRAVGKASCRPHCFSAVLCFSELADGFWGGAHKTPPLPTCTYKYKHRCCGILSVLAAVDGCCVRALRHTRMLLILRAYRSASRGFWRLLLEFLRFCY